MFSACLGLPWEGFGSSVGHWRVGGGGGGSRIAAFKPPGLPFSESSRAIGDFKTSRWPSLAAQRSENGRKFNVSLCYKVSLKASLGFKDYFPNPSYNTYAEVEMENLPFRPSNSPAQGRGKLTHIHLGLVQPLLPRNPSSVP